jgi:hypothetical protein
MLHDHAAPQPTQNFVKHIRTALPELRKSEAKVARLVLAQPFRTLDSTVAEVTELTDVSQPAVIRFCAAIGFSGFEELKLRLAQGLALGRTATHSVIRIPTADRRARHDRRTFHRGRVATRRTALQPAARDEAPAKRVPLRRCQRRRRGLTAESGAFALARRGRLLRVPAVRRMRRGAARRAHPAERRAQRFAHPARAWYASGAGVAGLRAQAR